MILTLKLDHSEEEHVDDEHVEDEHTEEADDILTTTSDDHAEDEHSHDSAETNPDATEGHYHVYLDDATGADSHSTLWTTTGTFEIPADTANGTHSLRFELRDNNHVKVGPEAVLFFEVE